MPHLQLLHSPTRIQFEFEFQFAFHKPKATTIKKSGTSGTGETCGTSAQNVLQLQLNFQLWS